MGDGEQFAFAITTSIVFAVILKKNAFSITILSFVDFQHINIAKLR